MKKLTKTLCIGLLSLASLSACTRLYNFNGNKVYYNEGDLTPMVIENDTAQIIYEGEPKNILSKINGKDITKIRVAKPIRQFLTGRNIGRYSPLSRQYLRDNKKDSAVFNKNIKYFDIYQHKIDSTDKARREQNRK